MHTPTTSEHLSFNVRKLKCNKIRQKGGSEIKEGDPWIIVRTSEQASTSDQNSGRRVLSTYSLKCEALALKISFPGHPIV